MKTAKNQLTVVTRLLAFAMFLLAGFGCKSPIDTFSFPLVPKPTDASYSGEVPVNMATLFVEVIDDRENKDQIGQNTEDSNKPAIKVTAADGGSPSEFVRKMLTQQLKEIGAPLADNADSAQRVISLRLTRFWAEEAPGYHGTVSFAAEIRDSGKTTWKGASIGESKRFGRSLSADNYRETISDATVRAINKMLGEPSFRAAISNQK
jgi:hypothetical protein